MTPEDLAKSGTEHGHQAAVFCWAQHHEAEWPELKWMHAIPNGGARGDDKRTRQVRGGMLKAEGVKTGVLDIFLPVPKIFDGIIYAGLYIEMKRENGKKSDVSSEQNEFIKFADSMGYGTAVCYGWKQATLVIVKYMSCQNANLVSRRFDQR